MRREWRWPAAANLLATATIFILASVPFRHYVRNELTGRILGTFGVNNLFAPAKMLLGRAHLNEAYEQYLADFRNECSLPPIQGTVDSYSVDQRYIVAMHWPYRPRPVIQSYSAYTPELAEMNAAHLRGDGAPENILFRITTVNGRFPPLDDGLSWPELFTRYDIQTVERTFVLMKRSAAPREFHLTPISDTTLHFGETLPVPPASRGPIWAQMEINPTLFGRIISTLYKPPAVSLKFALRDGLKLQRHLVPGMTRSGFVLSPLIARTVPFAMLASTRWQRDLADVEVVSLSVGAKDGSPLAAYYHDPIRVRLFSLDFPHQDLDNVPGFQW
jgi:hypothetical protein